MVAVLESLKKLSLILGHLFPVPFFTLKYIPSPFKLPSSCKNHLVFLGELKAGG